MRTAAFTAGTFVAIGVYLFVASIFSFDGPMIGIGTLAVAMVAAVVTVAATPARA